MTIEKNFEGKRISDTPGFVCGYAQDLDYPSLDNHVFLMFDVLPENGLLHMHFKAQYGDLFVRTYVKHIDFKPYNIYVFKRDLNLMNIILSLGDIKQTLPLEDDDSLYLPDDYSLTIKK